MDDVVDMARSENEGISREMERNEAICHVERWPEFGPARLAIMAPSK